MNCFCHLKIMINQSAECTPSKYRLFVYRSDDVLHSFISQGHIEIYGSTWTHVIFLSRDGYVLKLVLSIFWVMVVSFSRYWATVYVMVGFLDYDGIILGHLRWYYIHLWLYIEQYVILNSLKFLKILEILLKLVIIHTWCSFWGLLNSMYLYVTMNIPSWDISKWLSQVLMLWSALNSFQRDLTWTSTKNGSRLLIRSSRLLTSRQPPWWGSIRYLEF